MIIWGTRTKGERVPGIQPFEDWCPSCQQRATFVVKRPVKRFTLYFVPTFKIGGSKAMYQECQNCDAAFVYTRKETRAPEVEARSLPYLFVTCAAHVIRADGKVEPEELGVALHLLCELMGIEDETARKLLLAVLRDEVEQPADLDEAIAALAKAAPTGEARELLVDLLLAIGCADEYLDDREVLVAKRVARGLGVTGSRWAALLEARKRWRLSPKARQNEECLAVLGLQPGSSLAEVKAAYRELVAQYHPDKVAHLGPELRELAKRKTQQITEAYQVLVAAMS